MTTYISTSVYEKKTVSYKNNLLFHNASLDQYMNLCFLVMTCQVYVPATALPPKVSFL